MSIIVKKEQGKNMIRARRNAEETRNRVDNILDMQGGSSKGLRIPDVSSYCIPFLIPGQSHELRKY